MRRVIVRALAVLAVPLALGGLAAMGFGLASEGDGALPLAGGGAQCAR